MTQAYSEYLGLFKPYTAGHDRCRCGQVLRLFNTMPYARCVGCREREQGCRCPKREYRKKARIGE